MSGRYQASGTESEFEPGSDGRVLRNLVGIQSPEDMDDLELRLLKEVYEDVLLHNFPDRTLTVADLKAWHWLWLGNVYPWAGQERAVNLGKGGVPVRHGGAAAGPAEDLRARRACPVDTL